MALTADLFGARPPCLGQGAVLLTGFAHSRAAQILAALGPVLSASPLRRMAIPGGRKMSVQMSNCGDLGWVSDRHGYRYERLDPLTHRPWPAMPACLKELACAAAAEAGFAHFAPDVCLINRYEVAATLGLHQDKDEQEFTHPIVSLSLGLSAAFLWGGATRSAPTQRLLLHHADILVFGGPARLNFHGVSEILPDDPHSTGLAHRLNLTWRQTGFGGSL